MTCKGKDCVKIVSSLVGHEKMMMDVPFSAGCVENKENIF